MRVTLDPGSRHMIYVLRGNGALKSILIRHDCEQSRVEISIMFADIVHRVYSLLYMYYL